MNGILNCGKRGFSPFPDQWSLTPLIFVIEQWHKEKGMLAFSLRSREAIATVLDVLVKPVVPFAELRKDATLIDVGTVQVPVASIEHLIAMKTGTGRSKDQIDIEELRKILSSNE